MASPRLLFWRSAVTDFLPADGQDAMTSSAVASGAHPRQIRAIIVSIEGSEGKGVMLKNVPGGTA
jgi:hypothetical protein